MADEHTYEIKIRVQKDTLVNALKARIDGFTKILLDDNMKLWAADAYADIIEPLVPKKSGDLRKYKSFPKYKGTRAVQYDVPYAKAQYEGYNGRGAIMHWTTKGTHDHWNHHLSRSDREIYYDLVAEEMKKRLKNNG